MEYPRDNKVQDLEDDGGVGNAGAEFEKVQNMEDRDHKLKKVIRAIRLGTRVLIFVLACFTLYTQVYMMDKYQTTKDLRHQGESPWAKETKLWPTIVLLTSSIITVLVAAFILASYLWSVKHANRAYKRVYRPWIILEILIHGAAWIGTATAYRVGKTGDDLWGWSCSVKAASIQGSFPEVDFAFSCNIQTHAWNASIAHVAVLLLSASAQATLHCLTGAVVMLGLGRRYHKKRMNDVRQSLLADPEYKPYGPAPPMPPYLPPQ